MKTIEICLAATLIACSPGGSSGKDGGHAGQGFPISPVCIPGASGVQISDAPDGGKVANHALVETQGQVKYDPVELEWRCLAPDWTATGACDYGNPSEPGMTSSPGCGGSTDPTNPRNKYPPCLNGHTFQVEDAIRAQSNLSPLQSRPLLSDGNFDVKEPCVDATNTTLALVGTVLDPQDNGMNVFPGGLAYSGFGFGIPPFLDGCPPNSLPAHGTCLIGKPVFVVSVDFLKQLAVAIGQEFKAMMDQGVVVAHITKAASGDHSSRIEYDTGVAGAEFQHYYADGSHPRLTDDVYYINNDLTGATLGSASGTYTTDSGLIVRLNAGNAATYTAAVPGHPELKFETHLNGSRPGTALEVWFRQCGADPNQEGCNR